MRIAGAAEPVNILLTGATGFIGSHVAGALVASGHRVAAHVRPTSDTRWLDDLDIELRSADLAAAGGAPSLLDGIDAIVHAAGATRAADRRGFLTVNRDMATALAEAAARAGVRRFVLLSSLAARGPDQAEAPGDAPVSWYGASKLFAERDLEEIAGRSDMRAIALRLGGVYGPRDTDLLPLFQAAARGFLPLPPRGLHAQPVYVGDAVAAVLAALDADVPFGPWTIPGAARHPWSELGELVSAALGRRVATFHVPRSVFLTAARASERIARLRREAPRLDLRRAEDLACFSYTDDPGPAGAALGWRPEVSAREGLAATAGWYRRQGWLP